MVLSADLAAHCDHIQLAGPLATTRVATPLPITFVSARVVLYERRSRAVVIGDAFRSRLEAGLAAWAASMSATAICRPRAPPLGHELPADE